MSIDRFRISGKLPASKKFGLGLGPTLISSFGSDDKDFIDDSQYLSRLEPILTFAFQATKDAETRFREQISPSLLAEKEYHGRDCVAPFNWNECVLGQLVGSGEFSDVFELKSFRLENIQSSAAKHVWSTEEKGQRLYMKRCEIHNGTKKARYALKRIRLDNIETDGVKLNKLKYIQSVE